MSDSMFFIQEGQVLILDQVGNEQTLKAGDHFGEDSTDCVCPSLCWAL